MNDILRVPVLAAEDAKGHVIATHRIDSIHDLFRILKEQPEWKEELRRLILTEEILALPATFERFRQEEFQPLAQKVERVEGDLHVLKEDVQVLKEDVQVLKEDVRVLKEDVQVLKEDVQVLKEDVRVLKEDVRVLKEDVRVLKKDVEELKVDLADVKGDNYERKVRENAAAYLGHVLARARTVSRETLADALEDAFDEGRLSEAERDDAVLIDLVVRGQLRHDDRREVLLAVEVSLVVDRHDVERAARRAAIIGRAFGQETIGVAVGKGRTVGAEEASEALDVVVIAPQRA